MKKMFLLPMMRLAAKLFLNVGILFLAGCASEQNHPLARRGWIGGEYALAKPSGFLVQISQSTGTVGTLPKEVEQTQKAAILVTQLGTNTPAWQAGLRTGDFILELNHQPVKRLREFRRVIDHSQPGTNLMVKAWRAGQVVENQLPVGCEKYRSGGNLSLTFPSVVHRWDLWPNPGFSLVFLGFEPNPGLRRELADRKEVYDEEWTAYLVFLEVSMGKRVQSQEHSVAFTKPAPKDPVQFAAISRKSRP